MKKNAVTIILFIVFLLLSGIYFFVSNYKGFDKLGKVLDFKKGNLVELEIESNNKILKFVKENNFWKLESDKKLKMDEKHFTYIESVLNNLKYSRLIKKSSGDLSLYGLGDPNLKITMKTDNGISELIFAGNKTPSKTEYYVKKQNSENIYLINKGDLDMFYEDLAYYQDKKILSLDAELIDSLETYNVTGEKLKFLKTDNKWKLVIPVKAEIRNDIINEIINKLKNIQTVNFITLNNENKKIFNLEKPDYQIIVGDSNKKSQTINFGKNENGNIYFTTSDKNEIFSMSLMTFNSDEINIGELLNESPLSVGIDKVKKIIIKDNDQIIEIKKDESKPDNTFTKNGKEINKQDLTSLYINIMAVKATGLGIHNYQKPEFTIFLEQINSDQNITAEFVRKDNDSYYIFLNKNSSNFIVSGTQIEEIKKWLKRI